VGFPKRRREVNRRVSYRSSNAQAVLDYRGSRSAACRQPSGCG
jgi:hypothetical protein